MVPANMLPIATVATQAMEVSQPEMRIVSFRIVEHHEWCLRRECRNQLKRNTLGGLTRHTRNVAEESPVLMRC